MFAPVGNIVTATIFADTVDLKVELLGVATFWKTVHHANLSEPLRFRLWIALTH